MHFAALILLVDIQTEVLCFQEFTKIPGQGKYLEHAAQLLAQNFDAVLAVIVMLAGDTIFAIYYNKV